MVKIVKKIINGMILFYSKTEERSCFGCCSSKSCAQGQGDSAGLRRCDGCSDHVLGQVEPGSVRDSGN